MQLSVPAIVLGFLISVPLGYFANRSAAWREHRCSPSATSSTRSPAIALVVLVPVALGLQILNPLNVVHRAADLRGRGHGPLRDRRVRVRAGRRRGRPRSRRGSRRRSASGASSCRSPARSCSRGSASSRSARSASPRSVRSSASRASARSSPTRTSARSRSRRWSASSPCCCWPRCSTSSSRHREAAHAVEPRASGVAPLPRSAVAARSPVRAHLMLFLQAIRWILDPANWVLGQLRAGHRGGAPRPSLAGVPQRPVHRGRRAAHRAVHRPYGQGPARGDPAGERRARVPDARTPVAPHARLRARRRPERLRVRAARGAVAARGHLRRAVRCRPAHDRRRALHRVHGVAGPAPGRAAPRGAPDHRRPAQRDPAGHRVGDPGLELRHELASATSSSAVSPATTPSRSSPAPSSSPRSRSSSTACSRRPAFRTAARGVPRPERHHHHSTSPGLTPDGTDTRLRRELIRHVHHS